MSLELGRYIQKLRDNARKYELMNVNGESEKIWWKRNLSGLICVLIAIGFLFYLKKGFDNNFVTYASTLLSILIGLFINALIFGFDKFHDRLKQDGQLYDITISQDENGSSSEKSMQVGIEPISAATSKDKIWELQSYNYSKQFGFIIGYNIVLAVFAVAFLFLNSLLGDWMNYEIDLIHPKLSEWYKLVPNLVHRFLILYWLLRIMYNTLFVVSSMVNFMDNKIIRSIKK